MSHESQEHHQHGSIFDERFLMAVACIGAVAIGEWKEAIAVLILYLLGEFLQDRAIDRSRRSIRELMNVRPDRAEVLRCGVYITVPAESVAVGEQIRLRPGDRAPLDGTVIEGSSELNTAALTGESMPVSVAPGDSVLAGSVNESGTLLLRVDNSFGTSAASRILALVEEAGEQKAQSETFITRFSKVYTPVVVAMAALIGLLPPLLHLGAWKLFIYKALNFLVISCPCALVISVPLTYFAGLGCASRAGILIKGSNYMDVLAKARIAAFDKTGTLTEGRFSLSGVIPADSTISEEEILRLAAHAEAHSRHPLAEAVLRAYGKSPDPSLLTELKETAGKGISCQFEGKSLLVGKEEYIKDHNFTVIENKDVFTSIHVAHGEKYFGVLYFTDTVKRDAKESLTKLKQLGIRRTVLLSGDRKTTAESLGSSLGIDDIHAELLPEGKVKQLKSIKTSAPESPLIYIGDGINDAPVLALSDVGIAMGGLGSDAAMEAADVVIMGDRLDRIPVSIQISRKTLRIARENIIFAIAVKLLILLLASLGIVGLWMAVFADVGVCMLAVLNALRAMK